MMEDMYTFGVPHTVVTDQGPEFVSQMQNILFDSLNIDRKVTTGYHPRCNGAAEQFNKIMVSNIKAQMQQQGKSALDWEQCLAPPMFNYNTSDENNAVPGNIQLQPKITIVEWSATQV
jgi:hypothetical protein